MSLLERWRCSIKTGVNVIFEQTCQPFSALGQAEFTTRLSAGLGAENPPRISTQNKDCLLPSY